MVECIEGLAVVASSAPATGELATQLFAVAALERVALGAPMPRARQPAHDRAIADVRAALGEASFTAAWAAGERLSVERAMEASECSHAPIRRSDEDNTSAA